LRLATLGVFFFPPRASGKRLVGTRAKFFSGVERGRPEERSERRGGLVADSGVQFKGLPRPRWKVFQLRKIPRGLPGPTCRGVGTPRGRPREKIHARATSGDTREYLKRQTFERAFESKRRARKPRARTTRSTWSTTGNSHP